MGRHPLDLLLCIVTCMNLAQFMQYQQNKVQSILFQKPFAIELSNVSVVITFFS